MKEVGGKELYTNPWNVYIIYRKKRFSWETTERQWPYAGLKLAQLFPGAVDNGIRLSQQAALIAEQAVGTKARKWARPRSTEVTTITMQISAWVNKALMSTNVLGCLGFMATCYLLPAATSITAASAFAARPAVPRWMHNRGCTEIW